MLLSLHRLVPLLHLHIQFHCLFNTRVHTKRVPILTERHLFLSSPSSRSWLYHPTHSSTLSTSSKLACPSSAVAIEPIIFNTLRLDLISPPALTFHPSAQAYRHTPSLLCSHPQHNTTLHRHPTMPDRGYISSSSSRGSTPSPRSSKSYLEPLSIHKGTNPHPHQTPATHTTNTIPRTQETTTPHLKLQLPLPRHIPRTPTHNPHHPARRILTKSLLPQSLLRQQILRPQIRTEATVNPSRQRLLRTTQRDPQRQE